MCNAYVLDINDENVLKRYIYKIDNITGEKFLSPRKDKAFLNHLLKTLDIGSIIIFLVILSYEFLLSIRRHLPLDIIEASSIAGIAALVSFIIKIVIVWNEHNR